MLLNLKRMPVAVFVKENAPLDHITEGRFDYNIKINYKKYFQAWNSTHEYILISFMYIYVSK